MASTFVIASRSTFSPAVLLLSTIVIISNTPATIARSDSGDEFYSSSLYRDAPDNYEDKTTRNLDGIGGGNLLRDLSLLRNRAAFYERQQKRQNLDSLSGETFGQNKRRDILDGDFFGQNKRYNTYPSWAVYGISPKRNMDEMDRAGFSSFIKKKNFDELDRAGFDGFMKRNFDEMDRAGFGSFVKRDLTYQQHPSSSSSALQSPSSGVSTSTGSNQNHN